MIIKYTQMVVNFTKKAIIFRKLKIGFDTWDLVKLTMNLIYSMLQLTTIYEKISKFYYM